MRVNGGGRGLSGALAGREREGLARWRGEASCISQICRVIKLIKRLTHGGLVLLSVSPSPLHPAVFRLLASTASSPSRRPYLRSSLYLSASATVVLQPGVESGPMRVVVRGGGEGARVIETRRGGLTGR